MAAPVGRGDPIRQRQPGRPAGPRSRPGPRRAAILRETGLDPAGLQFEVTESAALDTGGHPVAALRTLAGSGIRISIDDFGTGYSNLAYLRSLPATDLKLAGEFVRGGPVDGALDEVDEHIVAAVVTLAHALGLTVTAEGVETAGHADQLRALGCDAGQGWHFARPMEAADLFDRLTA